MTDLGGGGIQSPEPLGWGVPLKSSKNVKKREFWVNLAFQIARLSGTPQKQSFLTLFRVFHGFGGFWRVLRVPPYHPPGTSKNTNLRISIFEHLENTSSRFVTIVEITIDFSGSTDVSQFCLFGVHPISTIDIRAHRRRRLRDLRVDTFTRTSPSHDCHACTVCPPPRHADPDILRSQEGVGSPPGIQQKIKRSAAKIYTSRHHNITLGSKTDHRKRRKSCTKRWVKFTNVAPYITCHFFRC